MWLKLINKKRRGEKIQVGGWPCCRLSPLLANNARLFLLLNEPPANLNCKWGKMNTLKATEGERPQKRGRERRKHKRKKYPNWNDFLHLTDVNDQSQIISLMLGATSKELCHQVKMWRGKKISRLSSMAFVVPWNKKQHYSLFGHLSQREFLHKRY